ncbi:MAG TPA: cytochrome c [Novosphingobium sp.]|nr:cytochrome c [Novosphingobium sp.]
MIRRPVSRAASRPAARVASLAAGALGLGGVLAAVLAGPAATPAQASPTGVWTSPQEAYDKICARCHLSGVGPELRGRALPPEYIKLIVRSGRLAMPAFPHSSIDDATLDGVARLVSAQKLPKPAAAPKR